MSTFPLLKTGAVTQYPASVIQQYGTDLVVFLDGTEQRSRRLPGPAKRWAIDLSQLDDDEMRRVEEFFLSQAGSYGSFSFTDPWSGTASGDCSFAEDTLVMSFEAQDRGKLRLTVVENRQ
jgi:Conserved hypothetical protein 2217 (DUF2460)